MIKIQSPDNRDDVLHSADAIVVLAKSPIFILPTSVRPLA